MRKVLVLMVAVLLIFSGAVMAQNGDNGEDPVGPPNGDNGDEVVGYTGYFDNPFDMGIHPEEGEISQDDLDKYYQGYFESEDDGIVYFNEAGDEHINLDLINRDGRDIYLDGGNQGKFAGGPDYQAVEVEMPAFAYIPCFLEIKVTGNLGTTSIASFGPQDEDNGFATASAEQYNLTFDNEVGGFVDENWDSLGYGSNVEFSLKGNEDADAFIRGCDIFAVEVMSNANHRYAVAGSALEGPGSSTLNMYMRTHKGANGSWEPEVEFSGNNVQEKYTVESISAGTESLFVHDFKVPYDVTATHGEYEGAVYFRAATI